MNPAIEIDTEELKKRFEISGMLPEQIELAMNVFEQSSVPLKISFPFKEFIKDGFTLQIVNHDLKKNDIKNGKFFSQKYNFGFYSKDKESLIPINYLKIPEIKIDYFDSEKVEVKIGVLCEPVALKDIWPSWKKPKAD
ncbi:hypothetical protein LEP1GSC041_1449 [Leptospira noguchii str. 2006001870]|uniref:hypothetical protein n=1 Tax=Leptospira noguchii TaxID=28182 RepID=UPI000248B1BC|nr:hypothetical protein [Leptospira noguchii]EKR73050.1 hypothetical protein LEP1GSC041_1449 [Leptospira noguchii str. 2006001870]